MSEILSIGITNNSTAAARELGTTGERLAADFLIVNGYRLVLSNFKVPIGRNLNGATVTGEIDIVALDESVLCFVEVKTRRSAEFAGPLANVDLRKQRQITRTSRIYKQIFHLTQTRHRYDVVTVLMEREREPQLELVKGYWSEQKFRKRTWSGDPW